MGDLRRGCLERLHMAVQQQRAGDEPDDDIIMNGLWDILQVPLESGVSRRDVLLGCVSLQQCRASAFM